MILLNARLMNLTSKVSLATDKREKTKLMVQIGVVQDAIENEQEGKI